MSAIFLYPGLTVRIQTFTGINAPNPLPVYGKFEEGRCYRVLGAIEHSPDGELYFILANSEGEIYRISNRHCRYVSTDERPANIDPQLWDAMQNQGT